MRIWGVVSWTPFGTAFWSLFGTILAPFWDHFGAEMAKKGGPKIDGKKGPKKVMRVSAGVCKCGGWGALKTL